ncbi:MAG: ComEA family DNA-binding protein [Ruminococcaceae bacterium]|nr:ComEA family DNA-binding protein [Oscillospiraceae bacterium]
MKEKKWLNDVLFYAFLIVVISIIVLSQSDNGKSSKQIKIVGVHVKGEVAAPGYYELDYGSRVKDAVLMAGGEKETANLTEVNMARKLSDGEEIIIPSVNNPSVISASDLININTADMYQLCKLDGIGEATATDIIEYRNKNGPFKNIQQIKNVKGIGDSKFNNIKDKITV